MSKLNSIFYYFIFIVCFTACNTNENKEESKNGVDKSFDFIADRFADIQVLRYPVPGYENLPLQQKKLAYYLTQAGLSGRDIFYDQKSRHGLKVRKTLEAVLNSYSGEKGGDDWDKFNVYCKRFFFSNGMYHHYSADKMIPGCSFEYFKTLINSSDEKLLPLEGMSKEEFLNKLQPIMFDPAIEPKTVDLSAKDIITGSSNNFYENVTQKEAEEYYAQLKKEKAGDVSQIGFNTKLVKENGKLVEKVWKSGGMYGSAIDKIIFWLEKALTVTENEIQKKTIEKLIAFYKSGDPVLFDDYSVSWVRDTVSTIDAVNGFIEVYHDALQKKGAYESIVSMRDMEATKRIAAISHEAQWFEDNSPIQDSHKKKQVVGISAKVITIISEVGDAGPSTPIGINLPNNEWIREDVGSKSVSLGNITEAYNYYKAKSPMIDEFGIDEEVKKRVREHSSLAGHLHTDMHEVIGHASGRINDGVLTTDQTLKNYAGVLEEARADLVALYYVLDQKLVDIGVMPSLETGKAQYYMYLLNGMMTQLQRIEPGKNLEQTHMRNRQLVSAWVLEKGAKAKIAEKITKDGKTFIVINDYNKLRELFGQLLNEIQRIKSEGDFEAGKNLVENYGVKVDQTILAEVHKRFEKLDMAPYMGFIQAKLVPEMKGDSISDIKVTYPKYFLDQMLEYGKEYSFLPVTN
jgi:dipeptidyl-peptidase-3